MHNGIPNLSVHDGWWIEGHIEGITEWSIGSKSTEASDDRDAQEIYDKLENIILPMYYIKKRIDGWPPCSTASPSMPLFSILSGWTNNSYYKGLSELTCSQEKGLKKTQRKEKKMEKMATDMIYRKIGLKSVAPLILTTFVIFLMFSCATVYHSFVMKGSIIEVSDSDVYLCIGSKDGASVGQELDVYKILETRPQPTFFRREYTGKVRIHRNYR